MKEIRSEHVKEIVSKLCEVIDVDPQTIDFQSPHWFMLHKWNKEAKDKFILWLSGYLKEHGYSKGKYKGKDSGLYDAEKLADLYGWEDED